MFGADRFKVQIIYIVLFSTYLISSHCAIIICLNDHLDHLDGSVSKQQATNALFSTA